jgi:hypothetical protein
MRLSVTFGLTDLDFVKSWTQSVNDEQKISQP